MCGGPRGRRTDRRRSTIERFISPIRLAGRPCTAGSNEQRQPLPGFSDPHILVLGGSGTLQYDLFEQPFLIRMRSRLAPPVRAALHVAIATLGRKAALYGAFFNADKALEA
jgi:hypothetical protein